jgi:hypothetical protein
MVSPLLEKASTGGSVTAWATAASGVVCLPLKLPEPDEGDGATCSTTSVATTNPLWAYSANGSA